MDAAEFPGRGQALHSRGRFASMGDGASAPGAVTTVDNVAARLHALILAAAADVVGPSLAADVLSLPKERPRASRRAAAGGCDFQCHAPVTMFRRLEAAARASAAAHAASSSPPLDPEAADAALAPGETRVEHHSSGRGVEVTLKSQFGLARRRHHPDPVALADAILEAADPIAMSSLVADVRVDTGDHTTGRDGGVLRVLTARQLAVGAARGLLLCRACGWMFAGDKGLREHRQVKHGNSYEDSKSAVAESRMALAQLNTGAFASSRVGSNSATSPSPSSSLPLPPVATAASSRNRDALDPGLEAARDGDLTTLRLLVETKGWDPARVTDRHGSNALHWAAGSGQLDACRYLVETLGMDPAAAQPRDGRTAMHWAARNGHVVICEWLHVEHGVSADDPTRDGTTPFHWAVWTGRLDVCRWLVDVARADWTALNGYGCNAAQWAAQSGDVRTCEYLRDLGLDLGLLNDNGHSALHKAATKGHANACEWFVRVVKLGAKHMAPDGDGNTPAEMARLEGHLELATWLEDRAAEANANGDSRR